MFKKASDAVNKYMFCFIGFSYSFGAKIAQKIRKTALHEKNYNESTFRPHFSKEILSFVIFVGSLWVPGGLWRRPRSVPEAFNVFINFRLDLKTGHD